MDGKAGCCRFPKSPRCNKYISLLLSDPPPRDTRLLPQSPFFWFLYFTFRKPNERNGGRAMFCKRVGCAVMQVLRVDVVCCTFAGCVTVVNRGNRKLRRFFTFVLVIIWNLSVARCRECSGGKLDGCRLALPFLKGLLIWLLLHILVYGE